MLSCIDLICHMSSSDLCVFLCVSRQNEFRFFNLKESCNMYRKIYLNVKGSTILYRKTPLCLIERFKSHGYFIAIEHIFIRKIVWNLILHNSATSKNKHFQSHMLSPELNVFSITSVTESVQFIVHATRATSFLASIMVLTSS